MFLGRSPIYVHASSTASGIITIRTCNKQAILLEEYSKHVNYHTQAFSLVLALDRWFAIRLESFVLVYRAIVVYACIFAKGESTNA